MVHSEKCCLTQTDHFQTGSSAYYLVNQKIELQELNPLKV